MQHSDWDQVFEEVEREVHGLIVEQQGQVEKAFALNNGKLDVTFKVTLEEKDSTFDVSVDVSFVKEKIKSGDSKRLVLGQIDLPGFVPQQAQPAQYPSSGGGGVLRLGAGALQLEAGEPLNLGPGQGGFSCETCRHGDGDGCNHADADAETCSHPTFALYEPRPLPATDDKFGHRRGPCNVGSRQHSDSPFYCGDGMEYTDVENRLMRVKEMGPEQLRAVIALPGCQKSVAKAAERRLRKLEKENERARRLPAVMTCGNCGSREGEHGCGLEVGALDEPCNSWSLKARTA